MKARFTAVEDFYAAVDILTERLVAEKHAEEARELRSFMHEIAWTTSSELLGELMLAFKRMNGQYSAAVTKEISECLDFTVRHRRILGLK